MIKFLVQRFTQLPGLSNEQPNTNNSTPEAKGYGTYWYKVENIERHGGDTVTTFLILFILMFKLTFVFFSYELYQRLIKQKLYKKTHSRYYTYWSAQVLIFGGLIGLGIFAGKFQSNKVALDTFWGSIGVDFVLAMIIIVIITLKANPLSEWKCLRNMDEGDAQTDTVGDSRFIPPPLLVCCQCCKCQPSNERCKRCMQSTKQVLIVLANGGSLFLFLAIGSYVAQALPAIAMSYYVNPTSTLIRLGFFELAIVILLMEISYLIFLCDKLSWLCFVNNKRKLPDELSNEANFISMYIYSPKAGRRQRSYSESGTTTTQRHVAARRNAARDQGVLNADRQPQRRRGSLPGRLVSNRDDRVQLLESNRDHNNYGSINPRGNAINSTQWKKYSCHWYGLCIIFFQIIALLIVIGGSAPALFFLMQIIIDQTSSSNNDFKDLLTILPTIALNAWLLLKHGDIIHTMKEIMKSAIKEQRGATTSTTHGGHRLHE